MQLTKTVFYPFDQQLKSLLENVNCNTGETFITLVIFI